MLKREDWIAYPREQPFAPGWYIVWVKCNDGRGYPAVLWFHSAGKFVTLSDRCVTHWASYQPPAEAI